MENTLLMPPPPPPHAYCTPSTSYAHHHYNHGYYYHQQQQDYAHVLRPVQPTSSSSSTRFLDLPDDALPALSTRFGTSSERDAPSSPPTTSSKRYDPLGVLRPATATRASQPRFRPCPPAVPAPVPAELSPGVLADGSTTARHPSVRAFLSEPEPRADDPRLASEAVRALVVLSVAHRVAHPAHLLFWDGTREDKERTVDWLHGVLQRSPPLIRPPVAWLGAPEELWLVRHLQEIYLLSVEFAPRTLRKRSRTKATSASAAAGANPTSTTSAAASSSPSDPTHDASHSKRPKRTTRSSAANAASQPTGVQAKPLERASSADSSSSGNSSSGAGGGRESSSLSPLSSTTPSPLATPRPAPAVLFPSPSPLLDGAAPALAQTSNRPRSASTGSSATAVSDAGSDGTRVGGGSPVLAGKGKLHAEFAMDCDGEVDADVEEEADARAALRKARSARAARRLPARAAVVSPPLTTTAMDVEEPSSRTGAKRKTAQAGATGGESPAKRVRVR